MSRPPEHGDGHSRHYQIRLHGQLDRRWSDWFGGFTLTNHRDGTTTLTGPVVDQAALHGMLRRIEDLGVTLIALNITAEGDRTQHEHPNERAESAGPQPQQGPGHSRF